MNSGYTDEMWAHRSRSPYSVQCCHIFDFLLPQIMGEYVETSVVTEIARNLAITTVQAEGSRKHANPSKAMKPWLPGAVTVTEWPACALSKPENFERNAARHRPMRPIV